jgi:hypothetical protein
VTRATGTPSRHPEMPGQGRYSDGSGQRNRSHRPGLDGIRRTQPPCRRPAPHGATSPRHRGSRNPHGVRRHRPACGHARADFTSPCTCWSAGEYTWDIPLSAGWTWPRMGRAARCPPGGGSLSARPSSGTTLAPFNARGSLGLTPCCGRVPVDSVVTGAANYQGLALHLCRLRCPGGLSGRGRGGTRRLSPSSSTR